MGKRTDWATVLLVLGIIALTGCARPVVYNPAAIPSLSRAAIRVEPVTFHERIEKANGQPMPGRSVAAVDEQFATFLRQRFEQELAAVGFHVVQGGASPDLPSLRIALVYRWDILLGERFEYLVQIYHRDTLLIGYPPFTINYGWPWAKEGIAVTGTVKEVCMRIADILIRGRTEVAPVAPKD